MNNTIAVESLEQLKQFLNDNNVLEIVTREKNKRIKTFQKVVLNNLPKTEASEMVEKAVNALNKNTRLTEKTLSAVRNVARVQRLGIVMNGLNLCSTCVGFAIMYAKLDQMSSEINQQIAQLQNVVKQGNDVQTGYEFNKVLADHTDMLDSRKRMQPYTESQMRELVDREYNVLTLLISALQKNIAADTGAMITSILSLLSMMTVSLCYFDEQYYFNNREVLAKEEVWHSAHKKWMSIFDTLSLPWFVETVQDWAMFNSKLNTKEVDIYCCELLSQIKEARRQIEDNQELVLAIGDIETLRAIREMNTKEVQRTLEEALKAAFEGTTDEDSLKAYEEAMKQVAVA